MTKPTGSRLSEASDAASVLRERFSNSEAPLPADARSIDRFLDDLHRSLATVFVGGLAFPDAELPDRLGELTQRAQRLGLSTPFEHCKRLQIWVEQLLSDRNTPERLAWAAHALEETQRLTAWLRLFRTEHAFAVLRTRLRPAADLTASHPKLPSLTADIWLEGVLLHRTGRAVFFGRQIENGRMVILRDQLAEVSANNPMHQRVLSRLFQSEIRLNQALGSLLRFENHPAVDTETEILLQPAFRSVPQRLSVTAHFKPPHAPQWTAALDSPGRLRTNLRRTATGIGCDSPLPIERSPVLRFNWTKLLAREATPTLSLDLLVLKREDTLVPLHQVDHTDGRVFPALDPTLFRTADVQLLRRATAAAVSPLPGAQLQATALQLVANPRPGDLDEVRGRLLELAPTGIAASYRAGLSAWLLGEPAGSLAAIAEDVLCLAQGSTDLDRLERVLNRGRCSPADLREVDGAAIYQALWLGDAAGISLDETATALLAGRYSGELLEPSVGDICARTLCLDRVEASAEPDEDEEGPHRSEALQFLTAHINDYRPTRGRRLPLPDLIEIFQLADTFAVVSREPRRGPTVAALQLDMSTVQQRCADALCDWQCLPPDDNRAYQAADALLVIATGKLRSAFVV